MDHFQRLRRHIRWYIAGLLFVQGAAISGLWWLGIQERHLSPMVVLAITGGTVLFFTIFLSYVITQFALDPLRFLWLAILHISPEHTGTAAPNVDDLQIGREMIANLTLQLYQIASQTSSKELVQHRREVIQATSIVHHIPLPLFAFNKDLLVTNASESAMTYCQIESSDLFGRPLFQNLFMEFSNDFTLEQWIESCQQNKVTDTAYWERVRVRVAKDGTMKQCDVAASYNRDNPSGTEFIVALFDHTDQYGNDDQNLSFIALAVHELRTPLTMLRGYIEALEEEFDGQMTSEQSNFMYKLRISADRLTAFVKNILSVAKVEQNQLVLHLTEEGWEEALRDAGADMNVWADINGKIIEYQIAQDIPAAGIDRMSIYEVVNNLLDNAIKYSGPDQKKIIVRSSLRKDGMIETTIQDFGVGIPSSVLPNLFEKFYRNHRTRAQIGGTGLGLFLCKAIIEAHGGQIWAESKEGKGSTFGFTLQPYANIADTQKNGNTDIVRTAHGWIKNHSLYRR